MNNLFSYVAAIKGEAVGLELVSQESADKSYIDQDINVDCKESLFHFSNGVIIKHCSESEEFEANALVCPECWISYEVISEPVNTLVRPKRKTFTNICQESFWLKLNKQQSGLFN
ncbi:hypothetical protein ACQKP8_10040 [Photobacterium alginatilyticum]|uniref:hypothetical protein n=1 Tax=Photobacterium alginatilyticum TaxID=1775171 RepID=UPI0040679B47